MKNETVFDKDNDILCPSNVTNLCISINMTAAKSTTTKNTKKATASKKRNVKSAGNGGNSAGSDVSKTPQKDRNGMGDANNYYDDDYDLKKGLDMSPVKKTDYHGSANGSTPLEPPRDKSRYKYRVEIQQMMFVSGETNDPPERTTDLIEDIVRDQVVSLVLQAHKTAYARGQKSLLPDDLIFVIRHDKAKVNRLRTYLSWKDVRKNAKDQETGDIGGGQAGGDLIEDAVGGSTGAGGTANNGAAVDGKVLATKQKRILKLPWELEFMFQEQPLSCGKDDDERIDEEEREAVLAQIKRLRQNDERTRYMTQQEYVHWSECRQASFTFRKSKRFREWCGMSQVTDNRPNDDVIDILGFLTFELVCSITEEALKVKRGMDKLIEEQASHRYLFMEPSTDNRPIGVEHIQEAWRRLQESSIDKRALFNFHGGRILRPVRFI